MIRGLACIAIVALSFVSPASAETPPLATGDAVYDTVDAVQTSSGTFGAISITGIIAGSGSPSALTYSIAGNTDEREQAAARCDRLALLVMSKPGKFQLAMELAPAFGSTKFSCKLIVRAP